MAKMFLDPQIVEFDIENTETQGLGTSGGFSGGWNVRTNYEGHNSGSHSEVKIHATRNSKGTKSGDWIRFTCQAINGKRIAKVELFPWASTTTVLNVSETGFTVVRRNHFNSYNESNPEQVEPDIIQVTFKNGYMSGEAGHDVEGSAYPSGDIAHKYQCDIVVTDVYEG